MKTLLLALAVLVLVAVCAQRELERHARLRLNPLRASDRTARALEHRHVDAEEDAAKLVNGESILELAKHVKHQFAHLSWTESFALHWQLLEPNRAARKLFCYWTQPGPLPLIDPPWLRGLPGPEFRVPAPWREPVEDPVIEDGEDELGFPPWLWSGPQPLIVSRRKLQIDNC